MKTSQKLTIELIRYAITGIPVDSKLLDAISDELLEEVYSLADSQDVVYIVGYALSKLNLLQGNIKDKFFKEQLVTLYRYESIVHELDSVSDLFEKNAIQFIPLKGSVIRQYYPKPEMRTSCDIDILIHKEDIGKASELLKEYLDYVYDDKCGHDISFYSPTETKLELHHTLMEYDYKEKEILDKVWEYAHVENGYKYKHVLDGAFFMFYHIVHMAKHLRGGGCGTRYFLDLHILKKKFAYSNDKLQLLLSDANLTPFADGVFHASDVWFGDVAADKTTEILLTHIFSAGAYGSIENQVAVSQIRNGSKVKVLVKRVFMPYKQLKIIYPIIEKHPVLTPWYEVVRWGRIIFKDKAKKQMSVIRHNFTISDEKRDDVASLFEHLGL